MGVSCIKVTIRQYRVLERKTSDYPALPGADMLLESLEQETLVAVVTSSESESLEDLDPEDFGRSGISSTDSNVFQP